MEVRGVPVDVPQLGGIRTRWSGIKSDLIQSIDRNYGVYDEDGSFSNREPGGADSHASRGADGQRSDSGSSSSHDDYDGEGATTSAHGRKLHQAAAGPGSTTRLATAFRLIFGNFLDLLGGGE